MTRKKIINYVLNNHVTSKAEIAKELNLSMPTVLANVNDLLEKGVLEETGEYASTGGRKAKRARNIYMNVIYCIFCSLGSLHISLRNSLRIDASYG